MSTEATGGRIMLRFLFEPRDLWVGCFWDRKPGRLLIYLCPLPMLVVRLTIPRAVSASPELASTVAEWSEDE